MSFVLAAVTNHTLTVCVTALALGFALGSYGHIIHSRTLVLTAIVAIGAICLYFVATGEIQTFG